MWATLRGPGLGARVEPSLTTLEALVLGGAIACQPVAYRPQCHTSLPLRERSQRIDHDGTDVAGLSPLVLCLRVRPASLWLGCLWHLQQRAWQWRRI
jgi:hypothetical protein